ELDVQLMVAKRPLGIAIGRAEQLVHHQARIMPTVRGTAVEQHDRSLGRLGLQRRTFSLDLFQLQHAIAVGIGNRDRLAVDPQRESLALEYRHFPLQSTLGRPALFAIPTVTGQSASVTDRTELSIAQG